MPGSFPIKLHQLLNTVHNEGLEWIVSWSPEGNGFKVHKVNEFVSFILPRFFIRQTKYKSFQRQLNIWDFDRITKGPLAGFYVHPKFLRGHPYLCFDMVRLKPETSCSIPGWPCEVANDQQEHLGKKWGDEARMNKSTVIEPTSMMDVGFDEGERQEGNAARPMTLHDCLIASTNPVNGSMPARDIRFDNPSKPYFSFQNPTPIEPILHSQRTNSCHLSNECWFLDDTEMGLPFHPTNLHEPLQWHDLEMIFS